MRLFVVLDAQRRRAESQLQELTVKLEQVQDDSPRQGKDVAQQIVAEVRKHIDIPVDLDPTVAQIVDAEKLKAGNPFYARVENGDYLVITPTRAILYSPKQDRVLDVIPVQISSQPRPSTGSGAVQSLIFSKAAVSARRIR